MVLITQHRNRNLYRISFDVTAATNIYHQRAGDSAETLPVLCSHEQKEEVPDVAVAIVLNTAATIVVAHVVSQWGVESGVRAGSIAKRGVHNICLQKSSCRNYYKGRTMPGQCDDGA